MSRICCYDLIVKRRDGTEECRNGVTAWNVHARPPELTLYRDGDQAVFYGFADWASMALAREPDKPIAVNPEAR